MPQETGSSHNPEKEKLTEEDFGNEDIVSRILVSGTEDEKRQLQGFYNVAQKDMECFTHFAQLRNATKENMKAEQEAREKTNPDPTKEELSMGAYEELIEPHVRDAVRDMRRKGYETTCSGFGGPTGVQVMVLSKDQLSGFKFSKEFIESLREQGVIVKTEPSEIFFNLEKQKNLDELKKIWDAIVEEIPDLGHPAPDSEMPAAQSFRKKHK